MIPVAEQAPPRNDDRRPSVGPVPAWVATAAGAVILATAGQLPLVIAIPLGFVAVAVAGGVLAGAGARKGRGAGHGVAGIVLAAVGLLLALVLPSVLAALPDLRAYNDVAEAEPEASTPSTPSTLPIVRLRPSAAVGTATAALTVDPDGTPVTADAVNAIDGDPTTAWRAVGDGRGAVLTVSFDRPVHLAGIGMIPGDARVDGSDGPDHFTRNGRVESARFTVDDGSVTDFAFAEAPQMQQFLLSADTSSVEITILSSVAGARGSTAVSEVEFYGWEAS